MPAPDQDAVPKTKPQSLDESLSFRELIQTELVQVHDRIAELLQSPDSRIEESLAFLTEQTGKMLRPALVLLSGKCFGEIGSEHIDLAAMVELVHRASLLHDDVIDSAELRRGQATPNALWGNTAAVLLGDFLFCRAFYLGACVKNQAAVEVLGAASQELCNGELMQNFQKENWDISESQYFQIVQAKTASLFKSSCQLGAIGSKAPQEHIDALGQFGLELGIAFQITDDLLDVLSTEQQAGKTLGTDLAQGKVTLPLIHWIHSDASGKSRRIKMIQQQADTKAVAAGMRESGSIDYAMTQVQDRINRAGKSIEGLAQSPAKDALMELANYVTVRLR